MNLKSKWLSVNNIVTALVLGLLLYIQIPSILNNVKNEGMPLTAGTFNQITPQGIKQSIAFPPGDSNAIVIFWATWCPPCKLEMARLKESVESGKIPNNKIFAINPFEEKQTISRFLSKKNYPFIFLEAPEISRMLKIEKTPTTLFLKAGKISSMSSGLSIFGIWRAENLF